MSQSTLQSAFETGAVKFNLAESDYIVLRCDGYDTYEKLFYRLPTREDLEKYMEDVLHRKGGFRDSAGIMRTYDKATSDWGSWKRSDDAACVRKLWAYGSTLCKQELDDMASGSGTGEKIKITPAAASELERKAVTKGMQKAVSDSERPSIWTLQKLANNFSLGGKHLHLEWENYVSVEAEEKAARSGKSLKSRPAVFLVGGRHLEVQEQEVELEGVVSITGLTVMREVLQLRARAFATMELVDFGVMTKLHDRYYGLLRQTVPDRMRTPTINEVRRFDRELMKQALKWKSEGNGELGDCLEYYLDSPAAGLWKLLEPVPESLPDQGQEKSADSKRDRKRDHGDDQRDSKRKKAEDGEEDPKAEAPKKTPPYCMICKKYHEPRCKIPEGWRRAEREKKKQGKQKGSGRGKSKPEDGPAKKAGE